MDDKEERKERVKLLRRQQERKNQLPSLLQQTSIIANKDLTENNVLTLEEIDNHRISINSTDFDFNYLNISFPQQKADELFKILQVFAKDLEEENYLILSKWSDIAVLRVKTDFVLMNFQKLIDLDGDSIYLYLLDYSSGFYIDLYTEWWYLDGKAERRPILVLRVFGKQWIKRIAEAL
ncbi:hypothetical protein AHMF7605_15225 [Adhaeribacter arboris]|uniref:Uncharacterized protein n=1 Tax=Adhaeribacter arboris TaxID=2072846 RepID=A0A2T2YGX6_9BACT|nr:hypothetical protein [Adhaeribacter arboris]PSR54759.1 hypothetical protein AHMF7605_15225 [Adhaeribacter arboris]